MTRKIAFPVLFLAFFLFACGGGGSDSGSAPPTAAIQASSTNIQQGQSVTISWQASGGTVSISGIGDNLPSSGSQVDYPPATTVYSMVVTGQNGQQAFASVTVNVGPTTQPPPTAAIQASSVNIQQGQSVTISWQASGGTVDVSDIGSNLSAYGTVSVTPLVTSTYTVTVIASDGQRATASVTVNVSPVIQPPPPTAAIQASSISIQQGQSVTISWQTSGGTITFNPAIVSSPAASGAVSVTPSVTTTYTITVVAPDGQRATASVTVNVMPASVGPPESPYLEISPERVLKPTTTGTINLTFTYTSAVDRVEIFLMGGEIVPCTRLGDYKWSANVDAAKLLNVYVPGEPRAVGGMIDVYSGSTRLSRANLFIPVRSASMPDVALQSAGPNAQTSPHVLNLRYDTLFLGGETSTYVVVWNAVRPLAIAAIGQRDFYVLVGQFEAYANATGGAGVLGFPNSFSFDLASKLAVHEIGHNWLAHSNHPLIGGDGGHWWPGNAADGIIGFGLPPSGGGAFFPWHIAPGSTSGTTQLWSIPTNPSFNQLELYKMGLIPKESVEPILQFTDKSKFNNWIFNQYQLPSCGDGCQELDVPSTLVTIDQIIAVDGATPPATKTNFTLGTIVLSSGRLLTADEMAFFDYMAARGEGTAPVEIIQAFSRYMGLPFSGATGGRMNLSTTIR